MAKSRAKSFETYPLNDIDVKLVANVKLYLVPLAGAKTFEFIALILDIASIDV